MPEVDEGAAQTAIAQKLKNGTTTLSEIIGPAWKEKLDQLAIEIDYARSKNIPLSVFETKAGAPQPAAGASK
jgi:hypothetical protein